MAKGFHPCVQHGSDECFPIVLDQILLGLALLTLSWDKNWDSHSLVNGYPSFYPRIALVAPSPEEYPYCTCDSGANWANDKIYVFL